MADRTDFYFRQKVKESELDLAFELLEQGDRNLASDIGLFGVVTGAVALPHSPVENLTVDLTGPGTAYDKFGQRIHIATDENVDVSIDSDGIPTEVLQAAQERWLAVFIAFDRKLSELRTDGNNQQIYWRRDEHYKLVVRQAPPGPINGAPLVPLDDQMLLVADIKRSHSQLQVLAGDIDTARRQAFVFATAGSVGVITAAWMALNPAAPTAQAALDEVDARLAGHFAGTGDQHSAAHIPLAPHAFVQSQDVEAGVHELLDRLMSIVAPAGAARIGAQGVPGTPHALGPSHVGAQLAALLSWLNAHVGAQAAAHNASAIAAQPHGPLTMQNVQAQLNELTDKLSAQAPPGVALMGASSLNGNPYALLAGNAATHFAGLLAHLNTHAGAPQSAHPGSAIKTVSQLFGATDAAAALDEIAQAFGANHFRSNEQFAGAHRAIIQRVDGAPFALLWQSSNISGAGPTLRVWSDATSVWFTLNARQLSGAWNRDDSSIPASAFRLAPDSFEWLHHPAGNTPFAAFADQWRLPMTKTSNSALEASGSIRETGHLAMVATNTHSAAAQVNLGGHVNFKTRFNGPTPNITLTPTIVSTNFTGAPSIINGSDDGFDYFTQQFNVGPGASLWWYGKYSAIA